MTNIEQKTTDLLRKYGLMIVPVDVKLLIKKLKIKLESVDFGEEVSGVLVTEMGKSKIGYSRNESKQRQRFTLAHELGQYSLHLKDNKNKLFVDNVKVMYRKQAFTNTEKKQEIEANRFAASLLMPKELILDRYNYLSKEETFLIDDEIINKLAKEFQVSSVAMTYRLTNLGLIEQFY